MKLNDALYVIFALIASLILGIAITGLLTFILCWCFDFMFSWKLAIGIYVLWVLIKTAITNYDKK